MLRFEHKSNLYFQHVHFFFVSFFFRMEVVTQVVMRQYSAREECVAKIIPERKISEGNYLQYFDVRNFTTSDPSLETSSKIEKQKEQLLTTLKREVSVNINF